MSLHIQTPVFELDSAGKQTGKSIFMKMECFQPAGSFKIRGIGLLCREAVRDGAKHLVSSSGGNAGYAVAYAGRVLGVKVSVVVPETTPRWVCEYIESKGAFVQVYGSVWDEAHAFALDLSGKGGGAYIPPFDHPAIWRGHSTIIDEAAGQCPKPDLIVLSVGGGGLLCGVVEGLHRNNWRDVPVVAVETEGAASFAAAVSTGRIVSLGSIKTVATSLGARQVAARALEWASVHKIIPVSVSDESAVKACVRFAGEFRMLVEPACGASLSVIYDNADVIEAAKSILVIVCGGIGVSLEKLYQWRQGMF